MISKHNKRQKSIMLTFLRLILFQLCMCVGVHVSVVKAGAVSDSVPCFWHPFLLDSLAQP